MPRDLTIHAQDRLRQRGITREDVEKVLNAPFRNEPGQPGSLWVWGRDTQGRILKVCISAHDRNVVITAARPS